METSVTETEGMGGAIPPGADEGGDRPSWVDVRDSWVGDRISDTGSAQAGPDSEAACSLPPPLPPADEVQMSPAARDDVRMIACQPDGFAPSIMLDRLAASDYAAALRVAEAILRQDPDHPDALQASGIAKSELSRQYLARLGSGSRVPRIVACAEELRSVPLDAEAGLVLSLVDGRRTIDEITAAGRAAPLVALRTLSELFLDGVVVLFEPDVVVVEPDAEA